MEANVKIPDQVLTDMVKGQILESLSNNPGITEKTVAAMLSVKKDSYSRETIFHSMATAMIQEVAKEVFSEWLKGKRAEIRTAIGKRLKDEVSFADIIADKLVDGLGNSFTVSVRMRVEE